MNTMSYELHPRNDAKMDAFLLQKGKIKSEESMTNLPCRRNNESLEWGYRESETDLVFVGFYLQCLDRGGGASKICKLFHTDCIGFVQKF